MSQTSNSTLPQGFSVFQPALGAQLQFFPALGSQELEDLVDLYVPGPLSASEKRATVALDFLEHTQITGQTFKFYTVAAAAASPATTSPATSVASSFNVSPLSVTWDWSQTSRPASVSSRSSSHRVSKTSPPTRTRASDFSNIPGMKIMTRDGMDVTNSASRGSKTKEQRDHAHLMRIIKACDSCRRKKIRCDPSHKKRGASQASTPAAAAARTAKQTRLTPPPPPPSQPQSASVSPMSSLDFTLQDASFSSFSDFDPNFTFDNMQSVDTSVDLWDEFLQFPPMDFSGDAGVDNSLDPAYLSSQPSLSESSASGSASPVYLPAPPGTTDGQYAEPQVRGPESTVLPTAGDDYEDFNLFSPGSTFSEDDRMLEVSSSSTSVRGLSTPDSGLSPALENSSSSISFGLSVTTNTHQQGGSEVHDEWNEDISDGALGANASPELQVRTTALDRVVQLASQHEELVVSTNANGQLVICCPPGTALVAGTGRTTDSDGHNVSSSLATNSMSSDSETVMDTTAPRLETPAIADLEMIDPSANHVAPTATAAASHAVVISQTCLSDLLRQASSSVASVSRLLASLQKAAMLLAESPGKSCIVSTMDVCQSVASVGSQGGLHSAAALAARVDSPQGELALEQSPDKPGTPVDGGWPKETPSGVPDAAIDGGWPKETPSSVPDTMVDGGWPKETPSSVPDTMVDGGWPKETPSSVPDTMVDGGWPKETPSSVPDTMVDGGWPKETPSSAPDTLVDGGWPKETPSGVPDAAVDGGWPKDDLSSSDEQAARLSCAINESIASVLCSFISTLARWHSDGDADRASSSRAESPAFGFAPAISVC